MGARPLKERIAEKRAQKERYDKKAEKCDEELKALLKKEAEETRKQRTHKLIVAGAELAALYGRTLEKDEILTIVDFLRQQKNAGVFTLEKTEKAFTESIGEPEAKTKESNGDLFGDLFNF